MSIQRYRLLMISSLSLLLALAVGSWLQWQAMQRAQALQLGQEKQLIASQRASESRSVQLQQMLELLQAHEPIAELELYAPVRWLAALQSSLAGVRASVLVDKTRQLSEREGESLIRVPIELEWHLSSLGDMHMLLNNIRVALGSFVSVESCVLAYRHKVGVADGYRVRCNLFKFAYRSVVT